MSLYYERDGIRVYHGDNREVVPALDEQFAAVVTDPPYGLSKEPDAAEVLRHWLAGDDYRASGGGFMGRSWDGFVPGPATWKVISEAMLPGAHLLAFSGTRTMDLLGMAIRLAGLHNRDTIARLHWVFGSGFPKSLDVSKAIDKAAGANRERRVVATKSGNAERRGEGEQGATYGDAWGGFRDESTPATPEAERWQGWGTALKPAHEDILVFRKPLAKGHTVAANVLAHGTGALNIDQTRVRHQSDADRAESERKNQHTGYKNPNSNRDSYSGEFGPRTDYDGSAGRWPPNTILDAHAARDLDAMSGESRSAKAGIKPRSGETNIYGGNALLPSRTKHSGTMEYGDTGGASRFFPVLPIDDPETLRFLYTPKSSRTERNRGLDELPEQHIRRMSGGEYTHNSGSTNSSKNGAHSQNHHPTVKPLALMRWLLTLVTPPGGVVLDPFAGSGTTGVAGVELGIPCVLVESEAEYLPIIVGRIDAALDARAGAELPLFAGVAD